MSAFHHKRSVCVYIQLHTSKFRMCKSPSATCWHTSGVSTSGRNWLVFLTRSRAVNKARGWRPWRDLATMSLKRSQRRRVPPAAIKIERESSPEPEDEVPLAQIDIEPESSEDESDDEAPAERKKIKKEPPSGGGYRYPRKFNPRWLSIDEVKDWIHPLKMDPRHVWCKYCKKKIRAHLTDMRTHNKTKKHHRNMSTVRPEIPAELQMPPSGFPENVPSNNIVITFPSQKNSSQEVIGLVEPHLLMASAPSNRNLEKLPSGMRTTNDNNRLVKECDIIFLCVKPHLLTEMIEGLDPLERDHSPLFISVVTGFDICTLEQLLGSLIDAPRVVRTMPNTPCMVGQGCCVYTMGTNTNESDAKVVCSILHSVGYSAEIPEYQMDAACGLAGSGPAYIYTAIEALADGGVKMGLPRHLAHSLAAHTVKGAASMVLQSGKHPAQLKDEVCSPGGTTITAIHSLEKNGFRGALISAVEASANRAKELGNKS
ncbi:pyrroline-5-carboxylate reductase 3-like isoform X2 [Macrobrachium nipponense]|uniref:pyrroline-5-carboxylate reductase 3-like isoform X2 n=1 Tax=Macrobrachium nipponense TaxID=159736 RepID=UPI0030C8A47D